MEAEIQRKIEDFRELGLPSYIPRDGIVHLVKNSISTIIGARRAGKSYRAAQVADELIKNNILTSVRQICPLDFDNPVLSKLTAEDLKLIPGVFLKITPELDLKSPIVFVFDEIHRISGWENSVIELSRNPNWKVIVTGSSSRLLRDEIATELRGKAISSTIYPLSFRELLAFKGFKGAISSTRGSAEIRRYFDEYLKWGGYPAVVGLEEPSKEVLLREYFDTMILRDIIQRYDVSKPRVCVQVCRYLLSNISKPVTSKSVFEYIKEGGAATSRDAIRDYLSWAKDSWLLFMVDVFSKSHREQERNYKKTYCIDWGLACQNSSVWDGSLSRAFENMIFLQLIRKHARVHYYLTRNSRQEVDFIALDSRGRVILAAQACTDIGDKDTLRRELSPLIASAKYFGINENYLITISHEKTFKEDGVTIHAIPAWKWLME
jgi:predicted AAA+ superfamily ATPase